MRYIKICAVGMTIGNSLKMILKKYKNDDFNVLKKIKNKNIDCKYNENDRNYNNTSIILLSVLCMIE